MTAFLKRDVLPDAESIGHGEAAELLAELGDKGLKVPDTAG